MRALAFVLLACAAPFSEITGEEEAGRPADGPPTIERLQFTEEDLPKDEKDPAGLSEIDQFALGRGFNYAKVTRRAARGDGKALKQFFEIARDADGAAADSHSGVPVVVYHLLGDEKFAQFLGGQPLPYQLMVRNSIATDVDYLRRHFPETTKVLFRKEMTAWPSPDKRYAIRKIFTDEFDLRGSKVERAELIDQTNGQVLGDLTRDDIGIGAEREGEVLWSPDSKRFAYQSSDLSQHEGNLFSSPRPPAMRKQTVVYQLSGESFTPVDLNLIDIPGREKDHELKGAILGHDYTEPVRWQKPNVLLLERHEYYEKLVPREEDGLKFESVHPFARWHRITATFAPGGKASVTWKVRKER